MQKKCFANRVWCLAKGDLPADMKYVFCDTFGSFCNMNNMKYVVCDTFGSFPNMNNTKYVFCDTFGLFHPKDGWMLFGQTYFGRYFWFGERIHDGLCKEKLPDLILLLKQYKKTNQETRKISLMDAQN